MAILQHMGNYAKEREAAERIARRAGRTVLGYLGCPFENKPDLSPVTAADRESERLIAAALEEAFPADGLLGEEGSAKAGTSGRRWIIDPIDGTRDFMRGAPVWAVLVALEEAGSPVVGCAYFAQTDEMFSAAVGGGASRNGSPIHAASTDDPGCAVLCLNDLNQVRALPWAAELNDWMAGFWAVRSYGGCRDAVMVAQGQADLWISTGGKPWDFAALQVIGGEAGACYFDFSGRPTIYGGSYVLSTPGLEREARRFLRCDTMIS